MIGLLCLAFPSTMMGLTYNLGMDKSSIYFAECAYSRSDDVYYIAYATEIAIEGESIDKIIEDEIGIVFAKVLAHAGVFKNTEDFLRFTKAVK
jgi:galactose-1-phosphate uridylyltransferase